jgi:glycosyltransferase involved in cell wall biosynthesis
MTAPATELRHIGFFSPSWPPGKLPNGIVTYTDHITHALQEKGIELTVFSGDDPEGQRDGVMLGRLPKRWIDRVCRKIWRDWEHWRRIKLIYKVIKSHRKANGLQLYEMEESFGGSIRLSKRQELPVVIRLHGPWILNGVGQGKSRYFNSDRRKELEGDAIRIATGITSPSQFVLDSVRSHYGLALDNARVIPYPQPCVPASECWNRDLADPNTILFVGRFDSVKGGDLILDAFKMLCEHRPDSRLVIIGPDRGFLDDNGRRWSLAERLDSVLGALAKQVEWKGQLPRGDIDQYRRKASAIVVPSRSEPFGYTAVEALSLACPLIVSDAGGLPEIVQNEVNGLVFPSGDATALSQCMHKLLADRKLGEHLGATGRSDVASRYDPDLIANQIYEYHTQCFNRFQSATS